MIIASAIFINGESPFPGALTMIPTLGAALLIAAPANPVQKLLSTKPAVFVGEISYSLYLWHWPVIVLTKYFCYTAELNAMQTAMVVAASFALAIASYYIIERPLRRATERRMFGVTASLACTIGIVGVALVPVSLRLRPELHDNRFVNIMYWESHDTAHTAMMGDTLKPPSGIYLTGDSNANFMKGYFDALGKEHGFNFRTMTNDVYPPIPGEVLYDAEPKFYETYEELLPLSLDEISRARVIILQFRYRDDGVKHEPAVAELARQLKPDQTLVILSPVPQLDRNPLRVNRALVRDPRRDNRYVVDPCAPSEQLREIVHKYPNVVYLDLTGSPTFADAPFHHDTVIYYDQGHLNRFGTEVYARYTGNRFMQVLDSIRN